MQRSPLPALAGNQAPASDPARNIWLSASAGTGKTQVLAARVFRLLLRGVDPGAILCLTFTKAGAAEMAERISGRLAHWVRADDSDLRRDLANLGERATPELMSRARTLFAKVLDAPGGGLRIQTIHSFCQTLLSAFPVEAGLVPGFRPLEGREEHMLQREALAEMLVRLERDGRSDLIDAIAALSLRMGDEKAEGFLRDCARAPDAMDALPVGIQPFIRRAFDLPSSDIEALIAEACSDDGFDCGGLRRIIDANREWGTATADKDIATIEAWLAAPDVDRAASLQPLYSVFYTGKDEPRKYSKKLLEADPGYAELAIDLAERCAELLKLRTRGAYADLLAQAFDAGREYSATYRQLKRRRGAVDYDDLIRRTVALLATPGMGDWVRFKLDQSTEHLLIDEAQDTNAQQWAIAGAIADEFFTGRGTRESGVRTLFTVGDYKQAIYGFQGTAPEFFKAAQERFRRLAENAPDYDVDAPELESLSLTHSFRSTQPVLEFVDAAIAELPEPGMGPFSEAEPHASRVPGPGTITLWPPVDIGMSGEGDEEEWVDDSIREVAKRIAQNIRDWLDQGLMLESKGRSLRPEDIMILVKSRGELASLIVARLYAQGVPVAGVDRLRLNAPLAVQDLLAAIRFVLQPEDDLSLAALLVSPLIGWSQDELMAAAVREKGGLWRHLRATQPEARLAPLHAMLARADFTTPYRFLEEILSGDLKGREKLLLRLGSEAVDPIEELLNAALNFEQVATPSLQRFLDWFDRGDVEIKRDLTAPGNAVRVMTAHGAKGLQAPLVILADAARDPSRNRADLLHWEVDQDGVQAKLPIFRPRKEERDGPLDTLIAETEAKELQEHWRLFYVAATRAEERLVIAGALSKADKGVPAEKSWYAAAMRAFDALDVPESDGGERVFRGLAPEPPVAEKKSQAMAAAPAPKLPEWAKRRAPEESRPPRPLAPSSLGDDSVADPPLSPAMRAAAERGRLLHALFERLPNVAPADRAGAADRWLAGAGGVDDAQLRGELVAAALSVIEHGDFAELFGPDALAEAPIAAVVDGLVVSGTVDRLVVQPDLVRVVDFKTGRRAPATLDAIPPYHLRQMAAYVAALRVIFPGRRVAAALLYTAGPLLHALPDDLLARYKPGYTPGQQSLPLDA